MDGNLDIELAFMLTSPIYPWKYNSKQATSTNPDKLKADIDEVIEMAIPLNLIGSNYFKILPIIRDNKKKMNLDEWKTWEKIQIE